MNNLITNFSRKLNIPAFIYIVDSDFQIYKNINKDISNISSDLIYKKLVSIIEKNIVNNEELYLISYESNVLGWVNLNNPIIIYNSFPQRIQILDNNIDNEINKQLEFNEPLEKDVIYIKKYFIEYNNQLYFGICNEEKIISFVNVDQVTDGEIEPLSFKFNKDYIDLYYNIEKSLSHNFFNDQNTYKVDFVFLTERESLGSFKFGRKRYWFELLDTDIEQNMIKRVSNRDKDHYILEHLFYTSNQISKMYNSFDEKISIEEEVVYTRINSLLERINELESIENS